MEIHGGDSRTSGGGGYAIEAFGGDGVAGGNAAEYAMRVVAGSGGSTGGGGVTVEAGSVGIGVNISAVGGGASNHALSITGNAVRSPLAFVPTTQPTGASAVGDMYMNSSGVLYACTASGTPGIWTKVSAT
jgi:hypothetical protein